MKKLFTFALAAATLVGFSACSNDEENVSNDQCRIILGVTTENSIATRAEGTPVQDISNWYAIVTQEFGDNDVAYGTEGSWKQIGSNLGTTDFKSGKYTIAVASHTSVESANASNGNYGEPYYTKTVTGQQINPGNNNIAIECGKTQNAKFVIDASGFSGTALVVNVTSPVTLSFDKYTETPTIGNPAFFAATTTLTYSITYTINGITNTLSGKTLRLGAAGTESTLTIKSNDNGRIVLSITYDNEYNTGTSGEIEIDAATGADVTPVTPEP